jgi:HPt (histidine-containing phosphotransfer) domain-containing protein
MTQQSEIINIQALDTARHLLGDRFSIIIKYFLEDTEMYSSEIAKGLKEKNIRIISSSAHTIKSSAKQLGIDRVSEVAKQMEILCREIIDSNNQNWEMLEKLYNSLNKELEKAIPELNKFR